MYFTAFYEKCDTTGQMKDQITYSKRVNHAVKMVDSGSRENAVLCTVVRSWLLFLPDESEWKNFESKYWAKHFVPTLQSTFCT